MKAWLLVASGGNGRFRLRVRARRTLPAQGKRGRSSPPRATKCHELRRRGCAKVGLPLRVTVKLRPDEPPVRPFRDSGGNGEGPAELG
jgi:hypothetical protein